MTMPSRRTRQLSRRGLLLALASASLSVRGQTRAPTPGTSEGPEFRPNAAQVTRLWRDGDPGTRLHLRARVLDINGTPLPGAQVQLWQADGGGSYQPERYRSVVQAGRRGEFALDTALPGQYYGGKHIHVIVSHEGYRTLTTRILFKGDAHLPAGEDELAILLEEVKKDGVTVLVGNVELVLAPAGGT